MKKIIMLSAVTRRERHAATSAIFDTINSLGGWVEDTTLFSNKMTNVRLEIGSNRLTQLIDILKDEQIQTDPLPATINTDSTNEITVTLQVTFIHDEPDLRREVPAVPG